MVLVFRKVHNVLRSDGTLWLNIGDSYANDGKWGGSTSGKHVKALHGNTSVGRGKRQTGLKPKDLIGVPWMLASALRADGWWLRSEVIWYKPNVMPESVKDRPTKAHEHVFLLAKSQNYYYDAEAIYEPCVGEPDEDRNKRTVWSINTQPYSGAHFAVMPPELAAICIKAGSKKGDVVLDPFAGSGTTLMMAKDLDRGFLGIEVNEGYGSLIEERMARANEAAGQRKIFDLAMAMEEG